eukprot:gene107-625_t
MVRKVLSIFRSRTKSPEPPSRQRSSDIIAEHQLEKHKLAMIVAEADKQQKLFKNFDILQEVKSQSIKNGKTNVSAKRHNSDVSTAATFSDHKSVPISVDDSPMSLECYADLPLVSSARMRAECYDYRFNDSSAFDNAFPVEAFAPVHPATFFSGRKAVSSISLSFSPKSNQKS